MKMMPIPEKNSWNGVIIRHNFLLYYIYIIMSNCNSYIKSKLPELKQDVNEQPTNKCRGFAVNGLTSVKNDRDYIEFDVNQSKGSNDYVMTDHNQNNRANLIESATCNPTIVFKDGKGTNIRDIDSDTKVTFSKVKYERKHQKQLFERPFATMPYIGKGVHKVNDESFLISPETTRQSRQCGSLAGVFLENQFTPLVPSLRDTVQNTTFIIPEDSKADWVRGGMSSRNIVKDIDYLSQCKDDDLVRKAFVAKKSYLRKK